MLSLNVWITLQRKRNLFLLPCFPFPLGLVLHYTSDFCFVMNLLLTFILQQGINLVSRTKIKKKTKQAEMVSSHISKARDSARMVGCWNSKAATYFFKTNISRVTSFPCVCGVYQPLFLCFLSHVAGWWSPQAYSWEALTHSNSDTGKTWFLTHIWNPRKFQCSCLSESLIKGF